MSTEALADAFKNSPFKSESHAKYVVHLHLADLVNATYDHEVWISQDRLARDAGVSVRTVYNTIIELVNKGWLERLDREQNHQDGQWQTRRYRYIPPQSATVADRTPPERLDREQNRQDGQWHTSPSATVADCTPPTVGNHCRFQSATVADKPSSRTTNPPGGASQSELPGVGFAQEAIGAYVDEYRKHHDGDPPKHWLAAGGNQIKRLQSQYPADWILTCMRFMGSEGKDPKNLAFVLVDYQRERKARRR